MSKLEITRSQAALGLRVMPMTTTQAGRIAFDAMPDHRLKLYVGAPVQGDCGAQRFVYTHGDVDLVPAGASESWFEDAPSHSIIVQVPPSLLSRAAADMGLDPRRASLAPRHQFRDAQIEHIALALDAERRAGSPSGLLYSQSLGMALAVHLLGRYHAPSSLLRGLSRPQERRVRDYIEARLDRELSLTKLADVAGLGPSHFKTLFKATFGLPVHAYVVQRRVERAKTLLLSRKLPASQVALEAGFAHQSHMARCMRKVLGVTPSDLVRAH